MTKKYTNLFHSKALRNLPKFGLKIYHLAALMEASPGGTAKIEKELFLHLNLRPSPQLDPVWPELFLKGDQNVPNCYKCYKLLQIVANVTNCNKLLQMLQNVPNCYKCYKLLQIATNVTNCYKLLQMLQIATNCYKLLQIVTNVTNCYKLLQMLQNATNCF
jgi:hypothetical protein